MAEPNKKQIMDVAKPGKTTPQPTARPIIVGHGSLIKDPMVSKDEVTASPAIDTSIDDAKGAKPSTAMGRKGKTLEPLKPVDAETAPEETEEPKEPEHTDISEKAVETKPAETKKADKDYKEPAEAPSSELEPSSSGDDAAVVGAVADQVALAKQQKEADEEAIARQEKIAKLIQDKTYFVPVKPPIRTRNTRALGIVALVILLLGAAAYAAVDAGLIKPGFDVPMHFLKKDVASSAPSTPAAATPSAPAQSATSTTTPASSSATTSYTNKDLGVIFSYPSAWGDLTATQTNASIKGKSVIFTFSKQSKVIAGMLSKDYESAGSDGACYVTLGIPPTYPLDSIKSSTKEGDVSSTDPAVKSTTRVLPTVADGFVFERFETGTPGGIGACPGASLIGYKSLPAAAAYTGIQFFWGGDSASRKSVAVSELEQYKANPNNYISATDRQDVLAALESAKSQ